ncbi:DUF5689 domain-containing protein [Capnocytophaga sp.]|uniref:DUF5689 domain-containing protein n=1 Tax=Capnocytophaga sp. TaxID=44737 RepID=UPI0026DBB022|nr:DUF5689 domain-containing protein [Capnocytophaga sp.]MDO5104836.1 DUF5689 domain-containing protein [Capnocytophaga sp.]
MKLKHLISIYSILLFCAFGIASCVKDTDYELPNFEESKKDIPPFDGKIITFAQATASSTSEVTKYTENDAIEGYVISSDEGGNFYKKIYIQNAEKTAGVSVSINKSGLYTEFPVGSKVQIRLKGLTTQINNGGLEIGYDVYTSNSGRKSVGQMAEALYKKHIYNLQETLKPQTDLAKADASVDVLKTNANVNQLVTFKNVSFESTAIGKTFHQEANNAQNGTNYNLIDANGKTITFRTSRYAKFINETVPSGTLDVTGVLTKYGSSFQFMVNTVSDIKVVGAGTHSGTTTVTELEAATATVADYADGKSVKLHGKITIDNKKPYFKLSDGTLIQIYAPNSVFNALSKEAKDKLKIDGQEITVTGTFKDFKNNNTGVTIKEIVYQKEADLVFGTTPPNNGGGSSVTELKAETATANDYADGKSVKLQGKITISSNKPHFKLSDGTLIQIYAPTSVFNALSQATKDKLKVDGQEITVTGTFKDYKNKSGEIIKEIVYEKEADLAFGTTPPNTGGGDQGGNQGGNQGGSSQGNVFDFENVTSNSTAYTNTETLTKGNATLTYKARTDLTNSGTSYAISGKGLMLHKNNSNPYIKIMFTNGVKELKFKYKGAFSGGNNRTLVVYDGDENSTTQIGQSVTFGKADSGTATITVNKTGSVTITIKSTASQSVVDDIEWTE